MGASKSKPVPASSMIGTPSSSAAFGRLRFDSPGKSPLLQRRLAQRQQQQHHHHHHLPSTVSPHVTTAGQVPRIYSSSQLKSSSLLSSSTTATSSTATSTTTTHEQSALLTKPTSSKNNQEPPPPQTTTTADQRKLIMTNKESSSLSEEEASLSSSSPPPLLVWIGPALTCAMCYALYNIFIKKGSSHISPILGGVILQFVAAMFGSALLLYLLLTTHDTDAAAAAKVVETAGTDSYYYTEFSNHTNMAADLSPSNSLLTWNTQGLMWAIMAGMAVGAAEMISFFVSSLGVQAMQSIPIIVGGSVLMGTLLGWLWLGEQLTVIGWSGVCLISIGIALVGLDAPADSHH